MSISRMIWQEIAHRKLNFALGLLSVVVAIATLAGVLSLLQTDQQRAEAAGEQLAVTSKHLDETGADLKQAGRKLEDEMRKIMLGLGFNIVILSQDEDLHAMNLTGVPTKTFHESNVGRLAESEDLLIVNHLLPIVSKRMQWPEQNDYEFLLTGTRGEVPQAHRAMKKPLQAQVPEGTMILGHNIAEQLKLKKGDSVKLMGRDFQISKIQEAQGDLPDSTAWINLKEAQDMLGMQNEVNAILALECNCASVDRVGEIRETIAKILPGTKVVERGSQALARAASRNQAKVTAEANKKAAEESKQAAEKTEQAAVAKLEQHEDLAAMLTPLVFVGCGLWIAVVTLANVRQRAEEIGILRAIGWRSGQIMGLFLGKAVILGLLGAVLGYLAGFAVTAAWNGGHWDQSLLYNRQLLLMTVILAPLLSAVASWLPALSAARNDPAAILQSY